MLQVLRILTPCLLATTMLVIELSAAQEPDSTMPSADSARFSLFGGIEAQSTSTPDARQAEIRRRQAATSGEPEFTLIGTSRIGDRSSAILRHRSGTEVVIVSGSEHETRINGFEQFAMLEIDSGRVEIRYPENLPCVEFSSAGVTCPRSGIATLELAFGDPLTRASRTTQNTVANRLSAESDQQQAEQQPAPEPSEDQDSDSRSLVLERSRAEQSATVESGSPVPPRRIDPADVPPGMEIFSTPFGDQLVPED